MSELYITLLSHLYEEETAARIAPRLQKLLDGYRGRIAAPAETGLSERDAILITYADQVRTPGILPLQSLATFCKAHLIGVVNGIHVLPFFPWSSDDGFAVKDYRSMDPALGSWLDLEELGRSFRLMIDGVINHVSAEGDWFKAYLSGKNPYLDYFLQIEGNPDLSAIVRPRTQPLVTEFQTTRGPRRVWTTFSQDQPDLDYHNPEVLLEILDILLMYAERGFQFIRLDAIAYLWKEIGTTCINLPQTHTIVQLIRSALDEVAPHVRLVSETNVPHADNISYFGNGKNEAGLVYNFALPPLVLHTFYTGDASVLSKWAAGLVPPSKHTAFLNFLASHDGIGLNPVLGILDAAEIENLVAKTIAHGGQVSHKQNADGMQSPYELNINYFDALSGPSEAGNPGTQIDRFMTAQAIMLCLQGVPGIYFHSLFGSRNWVEGVQVSGNKRAINREKLEYGKLERELANPGSIRSKVYRRFRSLLEMRSASAAFHPNGDQHILDLGRGVFALQRTSPDGGQKMLCLHNVTGEPQQVHFLDRSLELTPYQTIWQEL